MSNIERGTFEQTVCKHTLTQISSNNSLKSCSIPRTAAAAILGAEEPKGPMDRWGHLNMTMVISKHFGPFIFMESFG